MGEEQTHKRHTSRTTNVQSDLAHSVTFLFALSLRLWWLCIVTSFSCVLRFWPLAYCRLQRGYRCACVYLIPFLGNYVLVNLSDCGHCVLF